MKVLQHTQNVLVLRPAGAGLWLFVFGLVFLVAGLVSTFALGQTVHLTCERLEDRVVACEAARTFLGVPVKKTDLGSIQGAQVAEKIDDEGDHLYRVELIGGSERVPLAKAWSSGYAQKQRFAEDVNAFVEGSRALTLELELAATWSMVFGLVSSLIGLVIIVIGLRTRATTWVFDRIEGVVSRRVARLTGLHVTEYALSEIEDVRVESDSDGESYRIVLWMADAQSVPMLSFYSSGRRKKAETAALIRGFLGLGVAEGPWPMP